MGRNEQEVIEVNRIPMIILGWCLGCDFKYGGAEFIHLRLETAHPILHLCSFRRCLKYVTCTIVGLLNHSCFNKAFQVSIDRRGIKVRLVYYSSFTCAALAYI